MKPFLNNGQQLFIHEFLETTQTLALSGASLPELIKTDARWLLQTLNPADLSNTVVFL